VLPTAAQLAVQVLAAEDRAQLDVLVIPGQGLNSIEKQKTEDLLKNTSEIPDSEKMKKKHAWYGSAPTQYSLRQSV
jgi:hypothetical protein